MHISTTTNPMPFTPKCLGDDSQVVFWVAPPSQADVDALGSRLFMHNIAPISTDTFRAIMIDEIFKIHGDERGEDHANLMDEFWQSEDLHRDQLGEWRLQEAERLFDIAQGAPQRDADPVPVKTMSLRRRTRAQLFSEEMRAASVVIRQKTIDLNDHDQKTQDGITRLLLTGWSGVETPFEKPDGIVDAGRFSAVKFEIGAAAIAELHQFVAGLLRVDGTERGNLELAARERVRSDWFARTQRRIGEQRWEFDGIWYHTNPQLRIRSDHRAVVDLYFRCNWREREHRRYPDGRGVIHQPLRLLQALDIVDEYFRENEA